jgi:hypothetical protein
MSKRITEQFSKAALSDDGALEQVLCQIAKVQHQAVEQHAYLIFLEHGGTHGHDLDDWLEAERLLFGCRCF